MQNLTTGSTVVVLGGRPNKVVTVVALCLMAVMILVFVLVVVGVLANA